MEEVKRGNEALAHIQEELRKVENQISGIAAEGVRRNSIKDSGGWWGYFPTGWGKTVEDIEKERIERD